MSQSSVQFTKWRPQIMYDERNSETKAPAVENAIETASRILSRVETMIDQLNATSSRVHGARDEGPTRGPINARDAAQGPVALLPLLHLIDSRLDHAMDTLALVRSGL